VLPAPADSSWHFALRPPAGKPSTADVIEIEPPAGIADLIAAGALYGRCWQQSRAWWDVPAVRDQRRRSADSCSSDTTLNPRPGNLKPSFAGRRRRLHRLITDAQDDRDLWEALHELGQALDDERLCERDRDVNV